MTKPAVQNAGDPEQVAKASKKENDVRETELSDVRWLLADARGRRFFKRVLDLSNVFDKYLAESVTLQAFHEGQRYAGATLLEDLMEADPDAFGKMVKEAKHGG